MKIIILCILTAITFCACPTVYQCEAFPKDHPLLSFTVIKNNKDTLKFKSDNGDTMMFRKSDAYFSPHEEKRALMNEPRCNQVFQTFYYADTANFALFNGIYISSYPHLNTENTQYSFKINDMEINLLSVKTDILDTLNSIMKDTLNYSNIIEFSDSLKTGNSINKIWIGKDQGLIKFWKGNQCWTLIE